MAMTLTQSRLRVTQAIYFGHPPGSGGAIQLTQGNGINNTPNPITGIGTVALGDLTADHNFSPTVANNFRIHSKNSVDVYNIEAYGAVGDGVTDNSAAIQAALVAAKSNGGTVEIPVGKFACSGLVLDSAFGVKIKGEQSGYFAAGSSIGSVLLTNGAPGSTMLELTSAQEFIIEGVAFDLNNVAGTRAIFIDSDNAPVSRMVSVRDVSIFRGNIGIQINHAVGATQSDSMQFERVYIAEMDATSTGIYINSQNASFVEISNSVILGGQVGIKITDGSYVRVTNTYGGGSGTQTFVYVDGVFGAIELNQCQAETSVAFLTFGATAVSNRGEAVILNNCSMDLPISTTAAGAIKFVIIGGELSSTFTTNNTGCTIISEELDINGGSFVLGANDRRTILTAGNIGFGIVPTVPVHVARGISGPLGIFRSTTGVANVSTDSFTGFNSNWVSAKNGVNKWFLGNDNVADDYRLLNSDANGNVDRLHITQAGNVGFSAAVPTRTIDLNGTQRYRGIAAPAVSEANSGTIYFDSATNKLKASLNGSAYVDVIGSGGLTGSGAVGRVAYWDTVTSVASPTSIYVDAVNNRLGVNVAVPLYDVHVAGDINLDTNANMIRVAGLQAFMADGAFASLAVGVGATLEIGGTAVGGGALQASAGGTFNTAIGQQSITALTTGTLNAGLGSGSLSGTTTGDRNVGVGAAAGLTNTTGSDNVFIGKSADANANNYTNAVAIGANAVVGASDSCRIGDGSMKVGIRTGTPAQPLDVDGAVAFRHKDIAVVNGLNSDIALTDASLIRLTGPAGAFSVGGFTGGTDGRVLRIINTTAQAMTIVNLDAGSAAANQITTLTGADVVLAARTSAATLVYEDASDTWILFSYN